MVAAREQWDPEQYERFREARMEPLYDLLPLIRPQPEMSIIDLGCGTGEITLRLVDHFSYARALGIDTSQAMLDRAPHDPRLVFLCKSIEDVNTYEPYDLVFSHSALQWVPNHADLLGRILEQMRDGAQIAVQMPCNELHPSHRVARDLCVQSPFSEWLGGYVRESHTLTVEEYAILLHAFGCARPICMERVYLHVLPHTADVVEWSKGTLLTSYLSRLDPPQQYEFLEAYRARLLEELGNESPYVYTFRRLLFWGRKR